jgi:hypothetical protein
LFTGNLTGIVDAPDFTRTIRFRLGPAAHIEEIGRHSMEISRASLSCVSQLDCQPVLTQNTSAASGSPAYLRGLPMLLLGAMAVDAARGCLESISFALAAWGRPSPYFDLDLTLMGAVVSRMRQLSPECSSKNASSVAQVACEYIEEFMATARLWQLYYRIYRPVHGFEQNTTRTLPGHDQGLPSEDVSSTAHSILDMLATHADGPQFSVSLTASGTSDRSQDLDASPPQANARLDSFASHETQEPGSFRRKFLEAHPYATNPTTLGYAYDSDAASSHLNHPPFDLEAFLLQVDEFL